MHLVNEFDPLIVSFSGSVVLSPTVIAAIEAGEFEPEGAFARFSGTCHAFASEQFEAKRFEAHEGFWCFDPRRLIMQSVDSQSAGDIAWFQTGVYVSKREPLPVPLLIYAGKSAVEQLGKSSIKSVRTQVPLDAHFADEEFLQQNLDQFCALSGFSPVFNVEAQLITRTQVGRWVNSAGAWFSDTNLEPFTVRDLSVSRNRVALDNRWSIRKSTSVCRATFSSPEWSSAAQSTIILVMMEAARAAGISGTAVLDVSFAEDVAGLPSTRQLGTGCA